MHPSSSSFFQSTGSNSAALGSAYRALHSSLGGEEAISLPEALQRAAGAQVVDEEPLCRPHKDAQTVSSNLFLPPLAARDVDVHF